MGATVGVVTGRPHGSTDVEGCRAGAIHGPEATADGGATVPTGSMVARDGGALGADTSGPARSAGHPGGAGESVGSSMPAVDAMPSSAVAEATEWFTGGPWSATPGAAVAVTVEPSSVSARAKLDSRRSLAVTTEIEPCGFGTVSTSPVPANGLASSNTRTDRLASVLSDERGAAAGGGPARLATAEPSPAGLAFCWARRATTATKSTVVVGMSKTQRTLPSAVRMHPAGTRVMPHWRTNAASMSASTRTGSKHAVITASASGDVSTSSRTTASWPAQRALTTANTGRPDAAAAAAAASMPGCHAAAAAGCPRIPMPTNVAAAITTPRRVR